MREKLLRILCGIAGHPANISREFEEKATRVVREQTLKAEATGRLFEARVACYCGRVWWPIDPWAVP